MNSYRANNNKGSRYSKRPSYGSSTGREGRISHSAGRFESDTYRDYSDIKNEYVNGYTHRERFENRELYPGFTERGDNYTSRGTVSDYESDFGGDYGRHHEDFGGYGYPAYESRNTRPQRSGRGTSIRGGRGIQRRRGARSDSRQSDYDSGWKYDYERGRDEFEGDMYNRNFGFGARSSRYSGRELGYGTGYENYDEEETIYPGSRRASVTGSSRSMRSGRHSVPVSSQKMTASREDAVNRRGGNRTGSSLSRFAKKTSERRPNKTNSSRGRTSSRRKEHMPY